MEKYKNYIEEIINICKCTEQDISLVTDTNNVVFKVTMPNKKINYAKFYLNKSSHIDHEMELYSVVDNKYLKEITYTSTNPKFTIFKELKGKTLDELSEEELENNKSNIVDSLINFFESTKKYKINGYGLVDENFKGKDENFLEFIIKRQTDTQEILSEYPLLNNLFSKILNKYKNIITGENSIVPIDTNMKNIMLTDKKEVKFIDPGEVISGPILMGYGDFAAHTYKTCLYDELMKKLKLDDKDEKRLRIYAIFSSMNVLAFIKKQGVNDLENIIPYGNTHTFFDLIKSHIDELQLNDIDIQKNDYGNDR